MNDQQVGAAMRAVRIRRRWRQVDVAGRAGVDASLVSRLERGHLDRLSLQALRRIAATLDIRLEVSARWRGGELDRMVNARHGELHEQVARFLPAVGWQLAPEVSFSIYGERGVIDILAWHTATSSLLVIELKTAIVDVQELVGTMDRKIRLSPRIAAERGWHARTDGTHARSVRGSSLRPARPIDVDSAPIARCCGPPTRATADGSGRGFVVRSSRSGSCRCGQI